MKFRKKSIEIEAVQFTGTNAHEIDLFMGRPDNDMLHSTDTPVINTLEGNLTVSIGDWVIRGVKGEFYPCKPDIFEASYNKV